jgi:iron(II)-dependent oxidoreductase
MSGSSTGGAGQTRHNTVFASFQGPVHSAIRTAGPQALARALQATRARTLGLIQAWHNALPDLSVPPLPQMNPPLWEWGHVAWFQEWWTVRNRQRHLGTRSPDRGPSFNPSCLPDADALYNSSEVAHDSRWALALPKLAATQDYLAQVLQRSLANLAQVSAQVSAQGSTHGLAQGLAQGSVQALAEVPEGPSSVSDEALYFWRLVLQHEDMHNEASVYMAQALGLAVPLVWRGRAGAQDAASAGATGRSTSDRVLSEQASTEPAIPAEIHLPAQLWTLGHSGEGFAFDNELPAHALTLGAFAIDAAAVTWARYLPFVQATGHALPPHVRWAQGMWQAQCFGQWQTLDLQAPAVHLNAHDAQAWCQWAGRRLPSEAEWACAAHQPDFVWGQVWEWTASDFAPYPGIPGFEAHPYRDYSAPWWHGHRVLRGACAATSAHVADVRYRNFFVPERRDIFAGFRSVAL